MLRTGRQTFRRKLGISRSFLTIPSASYLKRCRASKAPARVVTRWPGHSGAVQMWDRLCVISAKDSYQVMPSPRMRAIFPIGLSQRSGRHSKWGWDHGVLTEGLRAHYVGRRAQRRVAIPGSGLHGIGHPASHSQVGGEKPAGKDRKGKELEGLSKGE